jgi:hypothetical protein
MIVHVIFFSFLVLLLRLSSSVARITGIPKQYAPSLPLTKLIYCAVPGPLDTRKAEASLMKRAPSAAIGGRRVEKEETVGTLLTSTVSPILILVAHV